MDEDATTVRQLLLTRGLTDIARTFESVMESEMLAETLDEEGLPPVAPLTSGVSEANAFDGCGAFPPNFLCPSKPIGDDRIMS